MRRVGPRGVLLDVADARSAAATAERVEQLRADGVLPAVSVVPGACTVLVEALDVSWDDAGPGALAALAALAGAIVADPGDAAAGPLVEVPVAWDGPDLADVADRWGVAVDVAVTRLEGIGFLSAFCGFAPGFAYLAGLPDDWALPRLATPRPRVPAGSVALAGRWAGVYPTASPGGWRLVGTTDVVLFDPTLDPPALLAPGTRVRFVGR